MFRRILNGILKYFKKKDSEDYSAVRIAIALILIAVIMGALAFRRNYETVHPHRGPIVEAVYGLGTVTADRTYNVKTGVSARIEKIYARPGDSVSENAPLIRTDSLLFRAPFAGMVTSMNFEENEIVMPGNPILTMRTVDKPHIELVMDQESVLRIRPGLRAELSFETLRAKKIEGVVRRVYSSKGEFIVEVESSEMPEEVLPDMTADVAIEVARRDDALLIPQKAVQRGQVIVIRHGLRKRIPVSIGAADAEWVEILGDDISTDDTIVVPVK